MLKRIHHINFLVKDLEQGIHVYTKLGLGPFEKDSLGKRGVVTARTKIGGTWFVLIQPTDPDGDPGKHLARHGEGFFLISFETEDLENEKQQLKQREFDFSPAQSRSGLLNWKVCDIDPKLTLGTLVQLTEELRP